MEIPGNSENSVKMELPVGCKSEVCFSIQVFGDPNFSAKIGVLPKLEILGGEIDFESPFLKREHVFHDENVKKDDNFELNFEVNFQDESVGMPINSFDSFNRPFIVVSGVTIDENGVQNPFCKAYSKNEGPNQGYVELSVEPYGLDDQGDLNYKIINGDEEKFVRLTPMKRQDNAEDVNDIVSTELYKSQIFSPINIDVVNQDGSEVNLLHTREFIPSTREIYSLIQPYTEKEVVYEEDSEGDFYVKIPDLLEFFEKIKSFPHDSESAFKNLMYIAKLILNGEITSTEDLGTRVGLRMLHLNALDREVITQSTIVNVLDYGAIDDVLLLPATNSKEYKGDEQRSITLDELDFKTQNVWSEFIKFADTQRNPLLIRELNLNADSKLTFNLLKTNNVIIFSLVGTDTALTGGSKVERQVLQLRVDRRDNTFDLEKTTLKEFDINEYILMLANILQVINTSRSV